MTKKKGSLIDGITYAARYIVFLYRKLVFFTLCRAQKTSNVARINKIVYESNPKMGFNHTIQAFNSPIDFKRAIDRTSKRTIELSAAPT